MPAKASGLGGPTARKLEESNDTQVLQPTCEGKHAPVKSAGWMEWSSPGVGFLDCSLKVIPRFIP